MTDQALLAKLDFHLIRVLHTVLTERSVSRAALRLGMHQPAVSAALRRLREIARDPLLVRSGASMVPTDIGLRMIEPSAGILRAAEDLFSDARGFNPATDTHTFRIAASDYLGPQLLPGLVADIKSAAPRCQVEIYPLVDRTTSYHDLAQGKVDVLLINWFEPTGDLRGTALFDDEIACMVSRDHPAVKQGWTVDSWLAAEHILPLPVSPYSRGMIDNHLQQKGLLRNCVVHCPHFGLLPEMVAKSQLVVTAGRRYFGRYTDLLPLTVLPCPIEFPRMAFYQVWHVRTDNSGASRWLREQVYEAAAELRTPQA
ncbi:MAG: hypothetical protein RIS88_2552 [Pseudomonadota bacterium]|jgi:DNA-binding transcriptional LysR family regulator